MQKETALIVLERERQSAKMLLLPETCALPVLNLEMAERHLCCHADLSSVVFAMACTSGLGSV